MTEADCGALIQTCTPWVFNAIHHKVEGNYPAKDLASLDRRAVVLDGNVALPNVGHGSTGLAYSRIPTNILGM